MRVEDVEQQARGEFAACSSSGEDGFNERSCREALGGVFGAF